MPYQDNFSYEDDFPPPQPPKWRLIKTEKIGPAFWTITSLFSLMVNVILIIALVMLGKQLFALKSLVREQVLGGLYENFVQMDQASIRTTIPVNSQVPAKFDLPLNTTTVVTLTEDTVIPGATIYDLMTSDGDLRIRRASTNIILPAGTQLPVALNLTVPVDQQIPVNLNVAVDIPLNQTELHEPFVGLREVVKPYVDILDQLPNSWQETLCGENPDQICKELIP